MIDPDAPEVPTGRLRMIHRLIEAGHLKAARRGQCWHVTGIGVDQIVAKLALVDVRDVDQLAPKLDR